MQIRKASRGDLETLSRLNVHVQQLHAEAHPDLFKMPTGDDFAVSFFTSLIDDSNIFIYLAEEAAPIGYIVLRVMRRSENAFMHPWHFVYIDQICVEPDYQGKGIGKALIEEAEKLAVLMDLDFVGLDSWDFNTEAHEFFYTQGYETFNLRMKKKIGK
jgi:ribosomal protein S18 acetylase RimI-like enzyme